MQGTPEYMAPETAKKKLVNERTDIFNFGATMYRLVTLRLPPSTLGDADMPPDAELWQRQLKPVQEVRRRMPEGAGGPDSPLPVVQRAEAAGDDEGSAGANWKQIAEQLDETGSGSHKVLEW